MRKYYSSADVVNDDFLPVPMMLLTNPDFSLGEVVLYAFIKNRMKLSQMNTERFEDERGIFVIYKQKDLAEMLHRDVKTIKRYFEALKKAELILVVQEEAGKPAKIYLRNLYSLCTSTGDKNVPHGGQKCPSYRGQKCPSYGGQKCPSYGGQKCPPNKEDIEKEDIKKEDYSLGPKTKSGKIPQPIMTMFWNFAGHNQKLVDSLASWYLERKSHKKTPTERACKLCLQELYKLSQGNERMMISIIDQSIVNGWQGFFPLKGNFGNRNGKSKAQAVYESLGGNNGEDEEGLSSFI